MHAFCNIWRSKFGALRAPRAPYNALNEMKGLCMVFKRFEVEEGSTVGVLNAVIG